MTLVLDGPDGDGGEVELAASPSDERLPSAALLTIAALASISAGIVHTGAIAAYSDHRAAVWTFLVAAVVEVGWGACALAHPRRWVALLGAAIGLASVVGWALATTSSSGIWFISGLDTKTTIGLADGLCAALGLITLLAASASVVVHMRKPSRVLIPAIAAVLLIATVPGTVSAVNHTNNDNSKTALATQPATQAASQPAAAPSTHPFDPSLPIDLSGVPGVTPQEQARAENLLAATVDLLPQWSDPAYDAAHGFFSIGDGVTGTEHYLNTAFINDNAMLDPDQPESLVFDTRVQPKKLVAAMYMGTPGMTLSTVPDIGGPLTQWHIHNNLCFTSAGKVGGLTQADGSCAAPLVKGADIPMIHVWIVPHECGPFAALEGIGAGQILPGQSRACDDVHGT